MKPSKWVLSLYALLIVTGLFTALPNVLAPAQLDRLPGWMPSQQLTLGLDLQGGSHLVLAVDAAALEREALASLLAESRRSLAEAGLRPSEARAEDGAVRLAFADAAEAGRAATMLAEGVPIVQAPGLSASAPEFAVRHDADALSLRPTEAAQAARMASAVEQSLEIIRTRIDKVGVSEPVIQRIGDDRVLVQLPGLQDPARLRELLGSMAQMSFHTVVPPAPSQTLPVGASWLPLEGGDQRIAVEDGAVLGGDRLIDARAAFDPQTGQPIVTFRLDAQGARDFAEITKANVGRPFAIVLDGRVLSAPVIQEPITGGSGQISGQFTVEDTTVLAALLRAGALPAPLEVIEERTVGPDLGADVIEMGIATGLTGFALVCGLMVMLYRGWGMVANAALFLNVVLTVAILTVTGAALTLPGIAGLILGLGIAVDANILINERIREETRRGLRPMAALIKGFDRAYATIVDANVTTLIATVLLFLFGSGPVRGFAVTMTIGILVSMFTAVAVVRIVMMEWTHRRRLKRINLEPLVRFSRGETSIPFMGVRYLGIGLSAFLSLASIGLFVAPGLNYGIDFRGGIQVEVENPEPIALDTFRATLGTAGLGEIVLQNVGGPGSVLVRVQEQPGGEAAQTRAVETVRDTVRQLYPNAQVLKAEVVGPKVSGELARSAVIAVTLASLAMMVYIWARFEWHFAIGAIATLVLDTTKTIGFFALTGLDFNLTAIAALLTIIGYSLNDKVVVYDRMRENLKAHPQMPLRRLIDASINQVFARCIYTSVATLAAVLPMAIWGGPAVASFAIPLVFGVVVATTSSIFIAAPILLFLGTWRDQRAECGPTEPAATPAE